MVPIHTDPIPLHWTVPLQTGWTVLILHALCAPVLPDVAEQGLRTVLVLLTGSPGVPGSLLLLCSLVRLGHQGAGDEREKGEEKE